MNQIDQMDMIMGRTNQDIEGDLRSTFESSLQYRIQRATRIHLVNAQPYHWFSAASADCAGMYVSSYFYGAISVAQAYVEALSKFLAEHHKMKWRGAVKHRYGRLRDRGIISSKACDAAIAIYKARNDFHHLNRIVPQDYAQLEARAENCVNNIFIIESEIFAYHIDEGKIVPQNPDYWTFTSSDTVGVFLRKL